MHSSFSLPDSPSVKKVVASFKAAADEGEGTCSLLSYGF